MGSTGKLKRARFFALAADAGSISSTPQYMKKTMMRKIISKLFRARRAARTSELLQPVAQESTPPLAPTPAPASNATPSKRRYGRRKRRHSAGPGARRIDPNGPIIQQARGKQ